jgi:hypothetical protein
LAPPTATVNSGCGGAIGRRIEANYLSVVADAVEA